MIRVQSSENSRLKSGVTGFDEIVQGGLLKQRSYLLVGDAGAGKTVFSLQWLREGAARGEKCVLITLIEPLETIEASAASFGWSLDGISTVDLGEYSLAEAEDYSVFSPQEVEREPLYRKLYEALETLRPDRLAIDSLVQLRNLSSDEYQFRKQMMRMINTLGRLGCTSLLIHEPQGATIDLSAALTVDGVIHLRREQTGHRGTEVRSVQVEKMRGSDFRAGKHHFRFGPDGITIHPQPPLVSRGERPTMEQFQSGIAQLDNLLGGGLEKGTITIISGPTGVGKSTLASSFLRQTIADGEKAAYISFEEVPESILMRNHCLGIPMESLVTSGDLHLEYASPRQYLPDEFFAHVRSLVDDGRKVIMIDGIRGYDFAFGVYGQSVVDLQTLTAYLLSRGVTVLLTNEVEVIAGELRATEIGASHLADNLILLRYAEYAGEVIKMVGCLKKRLGGFEPELREFRVSPAPHGVQVGPKLSHLRGLLTGTPTYEPELHSGPNLEKPSITTA